MLSRGKKQMAPSESAVAYGSGEDRQPMFEELALSVFCLLVTVIGLGVATWEAVSGRISSIDGLWLTLISLTLAAVFGGILAWSCYTGEAQQMLNHLRKGSAPKDSPAKNAPTPT
jgi:hypothetical protein